MKIFVILTKYPLRMCHKNQNITHKHPHSYTYALPEAGNFNYQNNNRCTWRKHVVKHATGFSKVSLFLLLYILLHALFRSHALCVFFGDAHIHIQRSISKSYISNMHCAGPSNILSRQLVHQLLGYAEVADTSSLE